MTSSRRFLNCPFTTPHKKNVNFAEGLGAVTGLGRGGREGAGGGGEGEKDRGKGGVDVLSICVV